MYRVIIDKKIFNNVDAVYMGQDNELHMEAPMDDYIVMYDLMDGEIGKEELMSHKTIHFGEDEFCSFTIHKY